MPGTYAELLAQSRARHDAEQKLVAAQIKLDRIGSLVDSMIESGDISLDEISRILDER